MATALRSLGFAVIVRENAAKRDMAPDGTVTSPGVSGGFTEDAFRGRWQRTGSRAHCIFDVTLKRQGTR